MLGTSILARQQALLSVLPFEAAPAVQPVEDTLTITCQGSLTVDLVEELELVR
jgi:hypothetical protein